jgi:hypothetical protein
MASIWNPWAKHDQLAPTWAPVWSKTVQFGTRLAPLGQLGANATQTCIFYRYFQCFLALMGFVVQGLVANIRLVLDPTSAPAPPTQDQVAHPKPNLRPNVPKSSHVGHQLGSSWSQLARVRRKLHPSWAKVGSCLAQLKAKYGQVWPQSGFWLGQVGPFLSSPSNWVRAVLAAKRLEYIPPRHITSCLACRWVMPSMPGNQLWWCKET